LPDGATPGKLLDSIENRLDELGVAYKLTLEQYGHLHGEVVDLRRRRDELITANNLAVELRRNAEKEAGRLARALEHANNHRTELLEQVEIKGNRAAELFMALRGILEIGKRDMSNTKYDSYFDEAERLTKDGLYPNV